MFQGTIPSISRKLHTFIFGRNITRILHISIYLLFPPLSLSFFTVGYIRYDKTRNDTRNCLRGREMDRHPESKFRTFFSLSTQSAFRKARFTLTLDSLKNFTSFKYFSRVSDVSKVRATGKYPRQGRRLHREREIAMKRIVFSSMKLPKILSGISNYQ